MWSDDLQCEFFKMEVDPEEKTVAFMVPLHNVPDMSGTIRAAQAALPEVTRIAVVAPDEVTYYFTTDRRDRRRKQRWQCRVVDRTMEVPHVQA